MSSPTCKSCGQQLAALEDHNERQCEPEKRRDVYKRGAAAARRALADARAAHTPTEEDT